MCYTLRIGAKMSDTNQQDQTPLVASPQNQESMLKDYAGQIFQPEDDRVTVDMIAQTVAAEFPEFMMAVAEENFLRGYKLGLEDATTLDTKTETTPRNEE